MAALATELKTALQAHYDLELPWEIEPFICADAEQLAAAIGGPPQGEETLYIRADEDALSVSLYLDKALLGPLNRRAQAWRQAWHGAQFSRYCTVLEGVSHLVCLLWHAGHERSLSRRDLELQAEVDKFIISSLDTRIDPEQARRLPHRLYEAVSYHDEAPHYREANELALHYCRHIRRHFAVARDCNALRAELARYYRMSGRKKREYIRSLARDEASA